MHTIEIKSEISDATVQPAIDVLNQSVDGDEVKILLPFNSGGSVDSAIALIESISQTKANVTLELDRYAISAAAFIWVWFFLRPIANVDVRTTGEPAMIVYHRPRVLINDHVLFSDDLVDGHNFKDSLIQATELFDELFEELLVALGYITAYEIDYNYVGSDIKHKLKHARSGYYLNHDCVIPA